VRDAIAKARKKHQVPLTRPGTGKEPLSPAELRFAKRNQDIFASQYHDFMKIKGIDNRDFAVITSDQYVDQFAALSQGHIGVFARRAGEAAARKVGVSLTDFIDRPNVQAAFRNEAYHFARSVTQSTRDRLGATLADGASLGESIGELTARVKVVFGFDPAKDVYTPSGAPGSRALENWRAERISRTESAQAISVGERAALKETGVVKAVEWLITSTACEFCQQIAGMQVRPDAPFLTQGTVLTAIVNGKPRMMELSYRDVIGPPLHPYCMCALSVVLVDMYEGD
jgi:hypothetical protein